MKSPFLKEDVPVLKVYVLTKKALKYMKQNLIQLKGEIVKSTVKAEFNTSLSVIDRSSRQKISKDINDLSVINQLHLIDTYGVLHPTTEDHQERPTSWAIKYNLTNLKEYKAYKVCSQNKM